MSGWTTRIPPDEIDAAERSLRAFFLKHRKELSVRPSEKPNEAVWRIARVVVDALADVGDEAAWWSGYKVERVDTTAMGRMLSRPWGRGGTRRHVGHAPPVRAEHKCFWLDTTTRPAAIRQYDRHSRSWRNFMEVDDSIARDPASAEGLLVSLARRFPELDVTTSWRIPRTMLRELIVRMLTGKMARAGKSGRPAYLAYATLAALLGTTPERIADYLGNYRRRPTAR